MSNPYIKRKKKPDTRLTVTLTVDQFSKVMTEIFRGEVRELLLPPPELRSYGLNEAAEMLGTHPTTLRQMAKDDKIKYFRIGNRFLFPRHYLDEFIEKKGSSEYTKGDAKSDNETAATQ